MLGFSEHDNDISASKNIGEFLSGGATGDFSIRTQNRAVSYVKLFFLFNIRYISGKVCYITVKYLVL
jgi:hypothetical protein